MRANTTTPDLTVPPAVDGIVLLKKELEYHLHHASGAKGWVVNLAHCLVHDFLAPERPALEIQSLGQVAKHAMTG